MIAQRTGVRPATPEDLSAIEGWYGEAAAAVLGEREASEGDTLRRRFEEGGGRLLVISREDDPAPIGLLDYRVGDPAAGWLRIAFIALATGCRGWGYGSEAVRLLEEQQGTAHYLAEVAPRNGLGVYFWLRLGYHPAHASEVLWRAPDGSGTMAMIRSGDQIEGDSR